ncbi:hypothetical protein SNE40_011145 [Patella caerulea]|uniref:Uncharacterized protein n=1 Tax=Patella caerulea TaxID=87958 RepID=A0AAN8PVP2_PATCE
MANYYTNLREYDRDGLPAIRPSTTGILDSTSARKYRALDQDDLLGYRSTSPTFGQGVRFEPQPNRRAVSELQDQVKVFRDELRKKDAMIQNLISLDSSPKSQTRIDPIRLRDTEHILEAKDIKIRELQSLLETNRENELRLTEIVNDLREQLHDLQNKTGSIESVAGRSEYTVAALQEENREKNDRIVQLEARLRKQLDERELAEASSMGADKKLRDLLSNISGLLRTDDLDSSQASVETVVRKLTDLMQENAMLKGKILSLNELLNNTETETKASRETIMRLVSEVGREQKVATRYSSDIENLRMERDNALAAKRDMEREVDVVKERLEANQRALDATRNELELREGRLNHLDREYRETANNTRSTSSQFNLFKEQLAGMLSNGYTSVSPSEEMIKEAVLALSQNNKELVLQVETLDNRVKSLTEQLDNQIDMQRSLAHRAKRAETDAGDLEEKLRLAEGDLAATDVLRDGFKSDKERYMRCLQRLAESMRMDKISADLGFDMILEALEARAQQLVNMEHHKLADKTSTTYNLQRKVKTLRDQLESKDLHLDLLRKKVTNLEERLHGRAELEKDRDSDSLRVKKLEKVISKYKLQIQDSRQEINNLKAQLLGASDLRARTLDQQRDVQELVKQVEELENLRKHQSHKISKLKEELHHNGSDFQEKRVVSENAVHALSGELRTTKTALTAIQNREKQLLDFRNVVARMLGLDINTLAVPDYEIISRLENFVKSHNTHAYVNMNLDEALADVEDGFLSGYEDSTRIVRDPAVQRSRDRSRRKAAKARARARSLSPQRRDPRRY